MRRVVHDLVHDLRDADRVAGRTLVACECGVAGRIRDVASVIGAVDVLPVPAGGEDDGYADAARARFVGELGCVGAVARGAGTAHDAVGFGEATVAVNQGPARLCAKGRVSCDHSETLGYVSIGPGAGSGSVRSTYGLEHCSLLVAATERPHVVDGQPSFLLQQGAVQATVCHLRNAPECAVLGRLEVDGCGPVVAEVLNHLARGTLGCSGRIDRHWVHLENTVSNLLSRLKRQICFIP